MSAERVATIAARLHEQHMAEFTHYAEAGDDFTADQCGNCQRWAKYALDAALSDERGGADTTTAAAVERGVMELVAWLRKHGSEPTYDCDGCGSLQDRIDRLAALSDPVGALARHDAEVLRAAAEEWPGLNDAGGNVYRWLRERADRIEGNQP